jgi:hypothetical protein
VKISSYLPADRWKTGSITVTDESGILLLGPVLARGNADSQIATDHMHPTRDPKKVDGDHPTGTYRVIHIEANKPPAHSYGPGFLLLGQARGPRRCSRAPEV